MRSSLLAQVPTEAGCNPGEAGVDLSTCFTLDGTTPVSQIYKTPADLVNIIVSFLFVLGGVILFLMIFYSGFKFIQSGTKGKDEAKTIMKTAVTGFVLMFVAYWIVRIIEILIGQQVLFGVTA